MNRRSFLAGILACGVAPSIVSADVLMRVWPIRPAQIPWAWSQGEVIVPAWVVDTDWTPEQIATMVQQIRPLAREAGKAFSHRVPPAPVLIEASAAASAEDRWMLYCNDKSIESPLDIPPSERYPEPVVKPSWWN